MKNNDLIRQDSLDDPFWNDFLFPFYDNGISKHSSPLKTDIMEKDGKYILEVDVPGYKKDNLRLDLSNGYLTIIAERKDKSDSCDCSSCKCVRKERYYGKYTRSFYVGDIKEEDVKAKLEDGTLTITFPKNNSRLDSNSKIAID